MQAWVIDSNMLQSDELRQYLRLSADNLAILTDFAWYEIYKQESLDGVRHGLSALGDHPDQTILLQSSDRIARLDPKVAEDLDRLILDGPHGDLRHFVSLIRSDAALEADARAKLDALWGWARTMKPSLIGGAVDFVESFPEMQAQMFDRGEIRIIRRRDKYTSQMIFTIFGAAVQIWEILAKEYRLPSKGLSEEEISRTYLFRFGLGLIMYLLWWIQGGSQAFLRIDRASNDFIDLSFAVHATYFDGLLTRDNKASWVHRNLIAAIVSFRDHYSLGCTV